MASASAAQGGSRRGGSSLIYIFGALGGLNWGYDTGVISAAILFMDQELDLGNFMTGYVVSVLIIGALIGAATGGRINDRFGRWKTLLITAIIFTIGPLGFFFATNVEIVIAARFALGLSAGLAAVTLPVYLSEIAPTRVRRAVTAFYNFAIVTGQFIGFIVGATLAGFEAWRWMLGLAIVPSLLFFIGLFFIWESPRWLVKQHREEEAWQILHYDRTEEARHELAETQEIQRIEREEDSSDWRELLAPWLRPILIVGIGLAILQQTMGINTIIYYAPTTLTNVGFGAQGASIANVAIGFMNIITGLFAIYYADRLGCRPLLLFGALGTTLALGVLSLTPLLAPAPTGIGVVGIIKLACLALYILFLQTSWGPMVWVMLGEIFPLGVRGRRRGSRSFSCGTRTSWWLPRFRRCWPRSAWVGCSGSSPSSASPRLSSSGLWSPRQTTGASKR